VTNLASLLADHPCADSDDLLHTIAGSVTAGNARAQARGVAAELRRLGVATGHAVAVQLPNGPELVSTMIGVWLAGAVYVPVNPRAPTPEVDAAVAATSPAAVITPTAVRPRRDPTTYAEGVALVLWTSGTTGPPKPVLHTHAAYLELIDRVLSSLRSSRPDTRPSVRRATNLVPVSMALNAGLYNALFGLRAGSELVIMDGFDVETFAALVEKFEITSTVLPPAAIAMLNDSEIPSLTPLRFVRSITAPLSPLQARRFHQRFGAFVLNGYGQAEIGEVIGWTASDARLHPEKLGAVGRPHPGVAIRVDDAGRLLVRPPNVAAGIEARRDDDGFIDTGDLAHIDGDGFVWIEGRAGDVINRGGNKVFPDAVEEVLRLSDAVDDVAVIGASDERLGEVPVAFIVGRRVGDSELDALCREHLAPYKVPTAFHWIETLPRSEVGKVLRRDLLSALDAAPASAGVQTRPSGDGYRLESVACPVCGQLVGEPVGVGEDFEYRTGPDTFVSVQCANCRVVYLDPRPVRDELARMYPDDYHAFQFDENAFGFVYRVRERLEASRLRRWCRGLPRDARVLDVGCGDGFHLDVLRRRGPAQFRLEGVDADPRAVARAEQRSLDVHLGIVEEVNLPGDSYDCVLLVQTIEHVHDPVAVLSEIRRLLRVGGRVVIVTDNTGSVDYRWFRGRWWGGYHFPRHLQLFNDQSMRALASRAGLEVRDISTMTSPVNWVYSVRNMLDDLGAPRRIVDQFSLRTPITLAAATLWDTAHRLAGRGALLRVDLRRAK
jgi:acyl-CoA synthetase (AMP-forming)/AMP-acid ligase II/SAM-dependent methyltransferase